MNGSEFKEYRALTPRSAAAYARAGERIPGGVTSNVRYFPPYPLFMSRAAGSQIFDVDGRGYTDYCMAFGPLIAGHGHPRVLDAMRQELDRSGTVIFGAPSEVEFQMATRLAGLLPSAEMTRFTSSGTEATLHASRIARGATGRTRIAKFEGHYHGVHDSVLVNIDRPLPITAASDGIPKDVLDATLVLPFNDTATAISTLEEADDVAAVIVEPVARGAIEALPDFLRAIREVTQRRGMVLIFDEIVSWPRVGLAGAQGRYGVTPDLTTLGKAIGGGLPLGAVVGRRDIMSIVQPRAARERTVAQTTDGIPEREGSRSSQPYVFHGGTYNGTPMALAGGLAVLDLLEHEGGWAQLERAGERTRVALRELFDRHGCDVQVIGTGGAFDFYFTADAIRSSREIWQSDLETRRALDYALLARGQYNSPLHRFHLSLAHSDADIERTLATIDACVHDLERATGHPLRHTHTGHPVHGGSHA